MSWQVIVKMPAQTDIDEAYIWYEEQSPGLGYRFIEHLDEIISKVLRNPFFASVLMENVRSASLSTFPYQVLYLIEEAEKSIYILAVGHLHRKPGWFFERIK